MSEIIGMDVAVIIVTISIVIAGIILGFGRALSIKRLELFGIEELIQSIINAALVGGIFVVIETIQTFSKELITPKCDADSIISGVTCTFNLISDSLFSLSNELIDLSLILGYYQSLGLDFGSFQIQPLINLSTFSNIFSTQILTLDIILILLNFNLVLLEFFAQNSILLFLPIGLVFRSFFATRKLGGFLIALSIGLYLLFPGFIAIFPDPIESIESTTGNVTIITNSSFYAPTPIVDLNDNMAIASKLDNLSKVDFSSDLTKIEQQSSKTISQVGLYSVFAPLFSLFLTLVFIFELGNLLGSNISFSYGVI